jgi:hypothetical protein
MQAPREGNVAARRASSSGTEDKHMRTPLLTIAAVLALAACGQNAQTASDEEGQYGASSGTNPNLADIQNDAGNTYPSQAAEGSVATTPGAEGGRGSAATGASDPGSSSTAGGDTSANTQQTPP